MHRRGWQLFFAAALLATAGLAGCDRPQAAQQPPLPEVAVMTIEPQRVELTAKLPGRTAGYLVAEIRPQVNGLIQERLFTEGAQVKAGDVLYQIDPAPYQAAFDNAKANLQAAKKAADQARAALDASSASLQRHRSTLALAKINLQRYETLVKTQAISAMQRDQAATDVDVAEASLRSAEAQVESNREAVGAAEAAIQQAEAALETARINLGYTKIVAPISGRIGRSAVTEGAIVTAYQALPLATIQQFDPIFVDVPQSTVELNRLRRRLAQGELKANDTRQVTILLEDGTPYPQPGTLEFRDITVDPTTGSVILRIVVPNPDGILLPGMFVHAVISEGINERAILVPQQAVSRDPKGNPYALVVDSEGKTQRRQISTERTLGDKWLVASGLTAGDRVVVEGMQRIRQPGQPVKVVPLTASDISTTHAEGTAQTALH
jgi:membrane fusion protein (multidrug efflux system)